MINKTVNLIDKLRSIFIETADDYLYTELVEEFERGDIDQDKWNKALVLSDYDEQKAKALYIRWRIPDKIINQKLKTDAQKSKTDAQKLEIDAQIYILKGLIYQRRKKLRIEGFIIGWLAIFCLFLYLYINSGFNDGFFLIYGSIFFGFIIGIIYESYKIRYSSPDKELFDKLKDLKNERSSS